MPHRRLRMQLLVHLLGLLNYSYGIYFEWFVVDIPESLSRTRRLFGGPWKYLTFWNLWLQLAFHLAGMANYLAGTDEVQSDKRSCFQRVRDFLFATTAFPIGIFVSAMYWGLFHYDRELVDPVKFDPFVPPLQDHMLHTSVVVLMALEVSSAPHFYPSQRAGMATTVAICLAYLTWVCFIAHSGGFWVYPILKVLNAPLRSLFIATCCLAGCAFYLLGEKLTGFLWGRHMTVVVTAEGEKTANGKVATD